MKYCLVKDGRAVEGDRASELVSQITDYKLDYDKRTMFVGFLGRDDGMSYSREFSDEEFRAEAAKRLLRILIKDCGWRLYQEKWGW